MDKGIKYGLTLPKIQKNQKIDRSKKKGLPKLPSVFLEDGDSENVENEIARQAIKKRSQLEVESMHAAALEQDAKVFDYDSVYDEMKNSQKEEVRGSNKPRESRYIGRLLEKAKVRQKEQEIVHERLLIKEREKEDHLYGGKEKFVTKAYREKLAENQMWLLEEKKKEAMEEANDVTKRKDLSDFYRNLLTKNVAFGGNDSVAQSSSIPNEKEKENLKSEVTMEAKAQTKTESKSEMRSESKDPSFDRSESKSRSKSRELEDEDEVEEAEREVLTSSDLGKEEGTNDSFISTEKVKKPDVQSARERYLARKKQKS